MPLSVSHDNTFIIITQKGAFVDKLAAILPPYLYKAWYFHAQPYIPYIPMPFLYLQAGHNIFPTNNFGLPSNTPAPVNPFALKTP